MQVRDPVRPPSYQALLGRHGRTPVMKVLRIRGSEVAGVLPEAGLFGQAGEAIDFILVRSRFAPGCPGHKQQQEQWKQRGSEHLREEVSAEDVYQSPSSFELRCSSPWGGAGAHLPEKHPPGSSSQPQSLDRCPSVRESPYLCFLASLLSKRRRWIGSHV